jgi:hypothetical protein
VHSCICTLPKQPSYVELPCRSIVAPKLCETPDREVAKLVKSFGHRPIAESFGDFRYNFGAIGPAVSQRELFVK